MLNGDDLPPLLHGHCPASSLLRGSPPLSGASVLSASRLEPLVLFPLASPARFSRSIQEPGRESRHLHAGCRLGSLRHPPSLSRRLGQPSVLTSSKQLSTLLQWFAYARLSRPCLTGSCPDFSATFTTMAFDHSSLRWLRSTPDCRTRRTFLHLPYSCASPCGPTMLVTQGPTLPSPPHARNGGYRGISCQPAG